MAELNFDAVAFDALTQAPTSSDKAAEALLIAVRYLREGRPLPIPIKDWIADALEIAAIKDAKHRPKALAEELFLTRGNRRPAASWLMVGADLDELCEGKEKLSRNSAIDALAAKYDVDQRTIRDYLKKWDAANEASRKVDMEERS